MTFRSLRIGFLLLVLVAVALGAWMDRARTTDWDSPLWIAIHPLNADGSETAQRYVGALDEERFDGIERFLAREAQRHGVAIGTPANVLLYEPVDSLPPALDPRANALSRALWSLRLRWWAWHSTADQERVDPHIRLFVLYHDPARTQTVPHSMGLQKGLVGVVHAFADRAMDGSNAIVIAHELLHTLGATDKYDPASDRPLHPEGFADPDQEPLYPQERAEVMAGRRMVSESEWEMPDSLRDVVVGVATAREINWISPEG